MSENDSRNEKNLAMDKNKEEIIAEKIRIAMLNDKKEITIEDGKSIIPVRILENQEDNETYDIEFGGTKIATVKRGEKVPTDTIKEQIDRYKNRFNFDRKNRELGRNPTENEKANSKSLELEAELKKAIAEGRAEK